MANPNSTSTRTSSVDLTRHRAPSPHQRRLQHHGAKPVADRGESSISATLDRGILTLTHSPWGSKAPVVDGLLDEMPKFPTVVAAGTTCLALRRASGIKYERRELMQLFDLVEAVGELTDLDFQHATATVAQLSADGRLDEVRQRFDARDWAWLHDLFEEFHLLPCEDCGIRDAKQPAGVRAVIYEPRARRGSR